MWTEHSERRAVVHPERVREPAERLKPSLEIMRLTMEQVRSPEPLTWRQVAPALPKAGHGARIVTCEISEGWMRGPPSLMSAWILKCRTVTLKYLQIFAGRW